MARAGASGTGAGKPRAARSGAARTRSPRPTAQAAGAATSATPHDAADARPGAEAEDVAPAEAALPEGSAAEPETVTPAPEKPRKRPAAKAAPRKARTAKPVSKVVAPAEVAPAEPAADEPAEPAADEPAPEAPASVESAPEPPASVEPAPPTIPPATTPVATPSSATSSSTKPPGAKTPAEKSPGATAGPATVAAASGSSRASAGRATSAAPQKAARALPDEIGGYRILGALGRGGMGAVYRARDGDGRVVALKLLHAHLDDPDARERLTREVASLQKVRHAGVARVLDAEIESTEAFVVTELVAGRDLGKHVKRSGALSPERLVVLATRLREALDVVHGAGVLHRDLTPGNVMVTAEGPVLIDFGLAQAVEDARVTSTGLVTGTPGYVSPDLLDGDAPTEASDWWGWAAVLTFAATGRPPFGRGAIGTVLTRVRAGEPDLAGIPEGIAEALRAALAVAPADRTTPDEVIAALEAAASAADAEDPAAEATTVLPADAHDDETVGETVVVTAVAPPDAVPDPAGAPDGWAHDGGTTVMPAGPEAWAAEDDAAYEQAYDEADGGDPGYGEGYDVDEAYDEAYDEGYDDEEELADEAYDELAYYPPPPARRTGTVAALALPFLALGLARPGAAFVAALVVAVLLRSVELDAEAIERRRVRRGPRPSDRLRALLTWPWYLVRGALGVVPVLVVGGAVVVLVGGVLWWLIEAGHWTVAPLVPGQGSGLLRGNLPWVGRAWVGVVAAVGLAMVWFGPMARTHRDGARRVLAKAAPGVPGVLAAVVVGVAVAAIVATAMLGQDVVWWPLGGPPDIG